MPLGCVNRDQAKVQLPEQSFLHFSCTGEGSLFRIHPSVSKALAEHKPVVALESTIITHGMPYPHNLSTAKQVEAVVRAEGATPATVAVIEGEVHVGLSSEELEHLALCESALKVSRRDLPYAVSQGLSGGTTVSATMIAAHRAGIPVFVTGGIGGVHRDGENSLDISADLTELGRTPIAVISAGVKSILDIGRTLEFLETQGVCVATYGATKNFPAFFSPQSGFTSPCQVSSPAEAARLIASALSLGLQSGVLLAVPIPEEHAAAGQLIEEAIQAAVAEARAKGITGRDVTPFILKMVNELTEGKSLQAIWYEPTDSEKASKPFLSDAWKSLCYSSPNLAELRTMNKTLGLPTPEVLPSSLEEVLSVAVALSRPLLEHVHCLVVTLGASGVLVCGEHDAGSVNLQPRKQKRVKDNVHLKVPVLCDQLRHSPSPYHRMSHSPEMKDDPMECPLCMEPLEIDDVNFFPCTCGYQICRFCWHRIRTDENGLCPACRKPYPEDPAVYKPLSQEEIQRIKNEKKQKQNEKKQKVTENRKHLASVRVVQRNLVFVVGLSQRLADPEVLKRPEYFGRFGKIHKVVINNSTSYAGSQGPSASAYVTYLRSEDALRAIQCVNNVVVDGRTLKMPTSDSPSPPPGLTKPSLVVPISVSDLTARSPFEGAAAESQSLFSDNSNFRHPNPLPAGLPPFPSSPRANSDWPMTPEPQSLFTSGTMEI
ncbi:CCR4-NOT transcription complex subunit 4 [Liparis tanakae]|uniref:CCR4-NOT transcription complex subunit 4 n=1 Tax=Liparis tanakae TaxID=230148 RepID=A0A4Z2I314_9TELE|nr:CCR4-NOT transcription complex subunit 4 [Liparis tanakae]